VVCGAYRAPEIPLTIEEIQDIIAGAMNANQPQEQETQAIETKQGLVRRTDTLLAVTSSGIEPMRWGFAQPGMDGVLPHARSESILEKPLFRQAVLKNRCLIPALLYYEKQYQFWPADVDIEREPFFMAGVYRLVHGKKTPEVVVVTREAAPHIHHIHDRMPVLLSRAVAKQWLMPDTNVMDVLKQATLNVCYELKPTQPKRPRGPEQTSMFG
jgi:putative SOS response-associated peptidase YedK